MAKRAVNTKLFERPFLVSLCLCAFVFTTLGVEKEPLQEYRLRRERLAQRIKGNVLVLRAAPGQELVEYRQERNFYYLTGFTEPNAILLLDAASQPPQEFLFLPERKPSEEKWTGPKLGPGADAEKATGFAAVLPISAFDTTLKKASERAQSVKELKDVTADLAALRQVKSSTEIALLERAIQITLKGHQAAARTIAPGLMEYEAEAAIEYEFRRNGAERPGFPSIVGSGPFSTILHYDRSERRMLAGETVVVDIGAEYSGYTADVTRTYPVSGAFSARQREIYQTVLDAQKAALARVKPGARISDIHQAAMSHIRSKGYDKYFTHGTSHHIGLEVHDVGEAARPLEPNMVITVEPGIYIPDEQIGIRIEDDVLVTTAGYRLLSNFPKEIAEIEALVKR
ncbi:MAG: aminopeptidase P family protein [Acidobacteria bacterium]|nr:aminopeptidase P family protein [Acidobacteriota bacterium]